MEYTPCFALVSFNSGTEIMIRTAVETGKQLQKALDFNWGSEVLDVQGQRCVKLGGSGK